jgi:TonB-dependent SusC/RagA subfamily outer membrane receptor
MDRARLVWALLAVGLLAGAPAPAGAQQEGAIGGTVRSARTDVPLAGATITVAGTDRATSSNNMGRFRLTGVTGDEVTIRVVMVGFRPITQVVRTGTDSALVTLEELPITIDELVVTGTPGAVQKRALGNSVATIDAAAVLETQPVADVGHLLQTRAAGVAVSEQMGVAGGGSRVLVRGPGSLTFDGNPIVYVDGLRINATPATGPTFGQAGGAGAPSVVSRLNDINPNDIESIEILKGPAAATLYGTQASAGVIQIITKRGRPGPMRITAQTRQGTSWLHDAENRIPTTFGINPETGDVVSTNFVREEAAAGNPLFRAGHLQEYALGISGGSETMQYYSGVEFQRNEGVVPSNGSNRFNGRLNLTVRPNEKFDADIGLGLSRGATTLYNAMYLGSFIYGQPGFRNTPTRGFLLGTVSLNHRPFSWLSHRLSVGQDYTNQQNRFTVPVIDPEYQQFFSPAEIRGGKSIDGVTTTQTTVDYSATGSFRPTDRLGSSTSFGLQYYRTLAETASLTGEEFPAPGVTVISGTAIRGAAETFVDDVTVGVYVQQQFSWNDRLFLTGGLRADDNSAFGSEFDLVTYPKASASWVISEEPFWNVGFFNALKLRAAYGESGQQPSSFAAIRTYSSIPGENDAPAGTPQSPGNPDLGPERGREIEFGFEASMLRDRLGMDFTYYDRHNNDVILQRSVAPSSGYSSTQVINAGTIINNGFELLLRGRPLESKNFSWDLSLNVSKNRNMVRDLGIDGNFIPVGWIPNRHQEGFPVDGYFRKKIVSADIQDGFAVNAMCDGGTGRDGVEPGGAPVPCAEAPYLFLGKPFYDWNGSVTSSFNFLRRWTFGAVFDFRYGGEMFESLNYWNCASLLNHEIDYFPERFDATRVAECQLGLDYVGTSRIQDAGYTKLRELSLNYQIPESFARAFGAGRGSITFAVRNLFTWTGYDGLDPETFTSTNWLAGNHSELVLPLPRTFMTTVSFDF